MPRFAAVSASHPNKRAGLFFWLILMGLLLSPMPVWGADSVPPSTPLVSAPSPGLFIENVGQFPPGIDFVLWGGEQPLWLNQDGIYTPVGEGMAKLTLAGGMGQPVGQGAMTTKISFLRGDDPAQWRANVPVWGAVRYTVPGTDTGLTVTADGRLLAQGELIVTGVDEARAGADAIRLTRGATTVVLPLSTGSTPKTALAVETDLLYATLIRGSKNDEEASLAVDGDGQLVIVGQTDSTDFPATAGGVGPVYAGGTQDAFVAKLAADGQALLFATFIGGGDSDLAKGVALDAAGNITIVGDTNSADFPTTDQAFSATFNGGSASDAFVTGLSPDGATLRFSTFLGGNSYDSLNAVALAPSGDLILAGRTQSADFFVTFDAYDSSHNGGWDVVVAGMLPDGRDMTFSTFLGGAGSEEPGGLAVDGGGNIYVGGYTWSPAFPATPGALDTTFNGGYTDAFVVKLAPDGESLGYATFLGGEAGEAVRGVAVDGAGHAVVTGFTASPGFPTTPGAYGGPGGGDDLFVAKLLPDGSGLSFASRFGGSNYDYGRGVGINSSGEILVAGETKSANFPITPGAVDITYGGKQDLFVAKLTGDGAALLYGSYLGGSADEAGHGLAVDSAGHLYLAGSSKSPDLSPGTVIGSPSADDTIFHTFAMKLTTPTRPITRSYLPFLAR